MSLASGSRLGPYEISGKLGAGGMGEVYKARDTRLGRTVAIKVLSASLAADLELRMRFEREARAISSLQHPHICTLFDVGREGEQDFLVMEFLDGEPLSERLERGPLSLEETLRYGRQIAEALDKAHRHGIVHRDLKPGNVIVTRAGVKLLDFGLAKLQKGLLRQDPAAGPLDSRTVIAGSEPLTTAGSVVGTPSYMAPEQLEGRDTDARCDIWALGCVLYQMISGKRPFERANLASLITAILSSEPSLPAAVPVPAGLERLIRFCLVKDPELRWQSAYDLALELDSLGADRLAGGRADDAASPPAAAPVSRWRRLGLPLGLGLATGLALAGLYFGLFGGRAAAPHPIRFQLAPAPGVEILGGVEGIQLAVAPDGLTFAYAGAGEDRVPRIYLRPVAAAEAHPLPGTEGATSLMWSPDGRSLAFFGAGKLRRLDLAGGVPVVLCDVDPGMGYAGSWGREGQIVFSSVQGKVLMRIPASGGLPEKLLEPDPERQEARVQWPYFLPDGRRILYTLRKKGDQAELMLFEPGQPPRTVGPIDSRVELIGGERLLYSREGALLAQRFDAAGAKLVGAPQAIAPEIRYFYSNGWAGFAASPSGSLIYLTEADSSRFYEYARDGRSLKALGSAGAYLSFSLAPDGRSLLADRMQPKFGTYDVWQLDLARGIESRLTSSPSAEFSPYLMPDGQAMIYSVVRSGSPNLVRRPLLAGEEEVLLPSLGFQEICDVSAAGDLAAFVERRERGGFHGFVMRLDGPSGAPRAAKALFPPDTEQRGLKFSPDGRYLAFLSKDSGQVEAYFAPLDNLNQRVRLSRQGAYRLRWRRDGREIVWLTPQHELISAEVAIAPRLSVGEPRLVFTFPANAEPLDFDLSADGKMLVVLVRERRGGAQPASVVLHWAPEADS